MMDATVINLAAARRERDLRRGLNFAFIEQFGWKYSWSDSLEARVVTASIVGIFGTYVYTIVYGSDGSIDTVCRAQ